MKKVKTIFSFLMLTLALFLITACKKDLTVNISWQQNEIKLTVGESVNAKPNVTYGKNIKDKQKQLTYEVADTTIATVTNEGMLSAKKVGTTTLKVTASDKAKTSKSISIIVTEQATYTITYDPADGILPQDAVTEFTDASEVNLPVPTREDYQFLGWYENDVKVETLTNKNYQLVAKWEQIKFAITFQLNNGQCDNLPTKYEKGKVTPLPTPSRNGYDFVGWFLNNQKIEEISASQTGEITIEARWEGKTYQINYQLNEGVLPQGAPTTYKVGQTTTLLNPTKEGYKFTGWYLNGTKVTQISASQVGEVTIEARWEQVRFNITFQLNGGVCPNLPATYEKGKATSLPTPSYEGYQFQGWFLNDQKIEEISASQTGDITIEARWIKLKALVVDPTNSEDCYETIAEVLAVAKDGDTITIKAGEYDEDVTISIPNLTIVGPNTKVDGNSGERLPEAVIKGVITVLAKATNLTIDGLSFTGDAKIVASQTNADYYNFRFTNNYVHDTTGEAAEWIFDRYKMTGFIQFRLDGGGSTQNFVFANNKFVNVEDTNIYVNRLLNISVYNNTFIDFGRDAFRTEGGLNYGILSFTDNYFEQTTKDHGYHGLFFYALAYTKNGPDTTLIIKNNTFKQIGSTSSICSPYNGAISSHFFQEAKLDIEITDNVFDHCVNYLWLRNNGATTSTWSCKVENNQFLGLPESYYFGTYQGTDSSASNPHLAEFGANYYEDNEGSVITDLSTYADMFKHLKTYGTASSDKPSENPTEPLEFYTITYRLEGGTLKGSYITGFTSINDQVITLPTPTRDDYIFLGWRYKDELVTELPASTKENVILVAEWEAITGDYHNVTYKFEGGFSEELLVQEKATAITSITVNNYNGNGGDFWGGGYAKYIYITDSSKDPGAAFSDRIYIGRNKETGLYEILSIIRTGGSSWAEGAEYVITISNSYNNYYASMQPIVSKLSVGNIVAFDTPIIDISTSNPANVYFFNTTPTNGELTVSVRNVDTLIEPKQVGYQFLGWFDETNTKWESLENLESDLVLTAHWQIVDPVTSIDVTSMCEELTKGETFQIVASVQPSTAYFKELFYESNNEDILKVSSTGEITAVNAGTATITIHDYLNKVRVTREVVVYPQKSLDVTFEENYNGSIKPQETLQLHAKAVGKDMENVTIKYESSADGILTVSPSGLVTAVSEGSAYITISVEGTDINLTVYVVVKTYSEATDIDRLLALIAENNFALVEAGNISLWDDGNFKVYTPVWGSVNRFLFDKFEINTSYYAQTEENPNNHKTRRATDTIEFVTVHDTATLTGTVESIANNMSKYPSETSIHYTVGNDKIYGVVPEKYISYHAGDGTSTTFTWTKTTAPATANVAPKYDIVTTDGKSYLKVNDTVTTIEVPALGSTGRTPTAADLTHLGPVWKVQDGYYWIGGPLWYSYSQIASHGGNNNSIGIEMCSNTSGDIYDTFQRTAKLVVDILIRNNLDTTRVKMHNTWSGKNCPQTVIAGDYWDNFMKIVELEYEIATKYKGAEITMVSKNPDIVDNTGRVIKAPAKTTTVSYEVTVKLNGETRTITLYSVVPGSTTWEQWYGQYPSSKIWNNGVFEIN